MRKKGIKNETVASIVKYYDICFNQSIWYIKLKQFSLGVLWTYNS